MTVLSSTSTPSMGSVVADVVKVAKRMFSPKG